MTLLASPPWIEATVTTSDFRVGLARHDRLQRQHDMRGNQDRVDRIVRLGGMAAAAVDGDLERVGGGHDTAFTGGETADRKPRLVVHAVDFLDPEFLHHAVVDHRQRAGAALFRRLEDDRDRTLEIAGLCKVLGRPEQHRGVAVMAAGMRLAGGLEAHGLPEVSRIGSASMSARKPMTGPSPWLPLMMPTTPVLPMPVSTTSQPNAFSFSATNFEVS